MGTVHFLQPNHPADRPLSSGDGGGTFDGMEPRVAVLENNVEHLKTDVGELRLDVRDIRDRMARMEEVVRTLPSKGFIVVVVLGGLALFGALIAFQDQVQAYLKAL